MLSSGIWGWGAIGFTIVSSEFEVFAFFGLCVCVCVRLAVSMSWSVCKECECVLLIYGFLRGGLSCN